VFLCHLLLGNLNACVDLLIATNRIPEAAFFARTYVPSRMTEVSTIPQLIPVSGRASLLLF
jgi:coatomer subunit beta'